MSCSSTNEPQLELVGVSFLDPSESVPATSLFSVALPLTHGFLTELFIYLFLANLFCLGFFGRWELGLFHFLKMEMIGIEPRTLCM